MAYGEGLGFSRYSLGDLYGGVKRAGGMTDYSRPDDTGAIIAALLAQQQARGLGANASPMIRQTPNQPTAQVPVMQGQPRQYAHVMTTSPGSDDQGSSTVDTLKQANDIYKKLNGQPAAPVTSGTGALPGSGVAQPINLSGAGGIGSAGLGSIGAGAMFGTSGSAALGAAAPVAADAALTNIGTIGAGELFGTSASAAAGAGAGSLGTAGGAGGLGFGTGASGATAGAGLGSGAAGGGASAGALAGSGLSTALPLAAIGWAAADALNAKGDKKSAGTSSLLSSLQQSGAITLKDPRTQTYQLPDGRLVRADEKARAASDAMLNGDQAGYQKAYDAWIDNAYRPNGELSLKDWVSGKTYSTPWHP